MLQILSSSGFDCFFGWGLNKASSQSINQIMHATHLQEYQYLYHKVIMISKPSFKIFSILFQMRVKACAVSFLIVAALVVPQLLIFASTGTHNQYVISKELLSANGNQTSLILDHENGNKLPEDIQFEIQTVDGTKKIHKMVNKDSDSLSSTFPISRQKIKNCLIKSHKKLTLKYQGRLLQETQSNFEGLVQIATILGYVIAILRNITIIAVVTNSLDFWMPLLIFIQMFEAYGLWTHDPHIIGDLLQFLFTTKLDVFNLIRSAFITDNSFTNISSLQLYGFTNSFFLNVAGEFMLLILLLVGTIVIKVSNIFVKNERLRSVNSKLRPIWNGFIFWLLPRSLTMAGYQFRGLPSQISAIDGINCFLSALVILGYILYTALLIVQIRRINEKLEYIEESRLHIGLARRIDHFRDFQFDCLQYSTLYYPVMNVIRMIVGFLGSGFAPDFHYVQFGLPLLCELFYAMIQISSSGYILQRDRILYPFIQFCFIVYLLCFMSVGMINAFAQVQQIAIIQILGFVFIIVILSMLVVLLCLDMILKCKQKSENQQENITHVESRLEANHSQREHRGQRKKQNKKKRTEKQINIQKQITLMDCINDENQSYQGKKPKKIKIKKIKKGKVI